MSKPRFCAHPEASGGPRKRPDSSASLWRPKDGQTRPKLRSSVLCLAPSWRLPISPSSLLLVLPRSSSLLPYVPRFLPSLPRSLLRFLLPRLLHPSFLDPPFFPRPRFPPSSSCGEVVRGARGREKKCLGPGGSGPRADQGRPLRARSCLDKKKN